MGRWTRMLPLLLTIFLMMAGRAHATTYYIAANGSDSNSGTSKTSPWLHAPGMAACTATCAGHTPQAGDSFIFRGGDTWHFGNSSASPYVGADHWNFGYSGAAGNPIYIGTDQTWYAGSSFARPIFSGDNAITTSQPASCPTHDFNSVNVVYFSTNSHIRFDDFEFSGFCYNTAADQAGGWVSFGGTDVIVEHNYFHGITDTSSGPYDEQSDIKGVGTAWDGDLTDQCLYNVFDNSDGSLGNYGSWPNGEATGEAITNTCPVIAYNVFVRVSNGIVSPSTLVHDNLFHDLYEPQGTVHGNIWNTNNHLLANIGAQGFYNNTFYDINEGVGVWLMPNPVAYIFNNVSWNITSPAGTGLNCYVIGGAPSATLYFYNNTVESNATPGACMLRGLYNGFDPTWDGTVHFANNHYIGYSAANLSSTYSCTTPQATCTWVDDTPSAELFQSEAVANGQGYTPSNSYAPTSASSATVTGAGGNFTLLCATFSPGSALCSGTSGGVIELLNLGGIIANLGAANGRPAIGPWNIGAYEFGSGSSSGAPNAPTALTAVVQ